MPVDSKHPDFDKFSPQWQRIRDFISGTDAIKEAGEKYLPKLGGQTLEMYNAYKDRALFFGASGRTVQGLLGALLRKDSIVEVPEGMEFIKESADLIGSPLSIVVKGITEEVISIGRYGVLVDMGEAGEPYIATYPAESILNWRLTKIDGKVALDRIVLFESASEQSDDEFEGKQIQQIRVLELVDGFYSQRLFVKRDDESEFTQEGEAITPNVRGEKLVRIPFTFFGVNDLAASVEKSPILDLVDVNISHYRSSADLEHGRHFTALPTPWISGLDATAGNRDWTIGSETAWVLPKEGSAGMLEFTGAGLTSLDTALEQKEKMMALLGARIVESQKKAAESGEALRLRQGGESSLLATIANTIEAGVLKVLNDFAIWKSESGDISYSINKDFIDVKMSPQELTSLIGGWQSGAIPTDVLVYNLRKGEVIQDSLTDDQVIDMIDTNIPNLLGEE